MNRATSIKVGLIQMDILPQQPEENLRRVTAFAGKAAGQGCRLVVLPELWPTGFDISRCREWATGIEAGVFRQMSRLAAQHKIFLQAGSMFSARRGKYYNTAAMFDPEGQRLGSYDKRHLFSFMREPELLSPGRRFTVYQLPWGLAGQSICYDLRFPELYRAYVRRGCEMMIIPAEWPMSRIEHWRALLRARAIENQAFVLGVNRAGSEGDLVFGGHSAVIDPLGKVLAEAGEKEQILFCEIDWPMVKKTREQFPALKDMYLGL